METVDVLESSTYVKLFHNILNLDLFQIKSNLTLFSIEVPDDEDIENVRNILKKELLVEILKTDVEGQDFFETCLKETMGKIGTKPFAGYSCCLAGCKFQDDRHRFYLRHLQRDHPTIKDIICNYKKKCRRSFSAVDLLVKHVKKIM